MRVLSVMILWKERRRKERRGCYLPLHSGSDAEARHTLEVTRFWQRGVERRREKKRGEEKRREEKRGEERRREKGEQRAEEKRGWGWAAGPAHPTTPVC